MSEQRLFRQWSAENAPTKYPFGDACSLTRSDGRSLLGVIADAAIYIVGGIGGCYVSLVTITNKNAHITISDAAGNTAAGNIDLLVLPERVGLADKYGRPAGLLVSAPVNWAVLQSWGDGSYSFTPAQAQFVAAVCFPVPAGGLQGFILPDGSFLSGDVWLVGGDGVVLTVAGSTIVVNAVGDPLFRRRACTGQGLFKTPRFIRKLLIASDTGSFLVTPDQFGAVQLFAGNGLNPATLLRTVMSGSGMDIHLTGTSSATGEAAQ